MNGDRGRISFKNEFLTKLVASIKDKISDLTDIRTASRVALDIARSFVKDAGGPQNFQQPPRIIPIPKSGGVLPLIPIFAALSALGSLAGGSAAIASAVNKAKHNNRMEEIARGKQKDGGSLWLTAATAALANAVNRRSGGTSKQGKGSRGKGGGREVIGNLIKSIGVSKQGKAIWLKPYKTGAALYIENHRRGRALYLKPSKPSKTTKPTSKGSNRCRSYETRP